MTDLEALYEAVVEGNSAAAEKLAREALERGADARTVLNESLMPAMAEVGRRMKVQEYYIPEVLVAARAMTMALAVLKPSLAGSGVEPVARAVLGTVKSDLHDIGKNLVSTMLQGAGFEVIDLGTDVSPERFVKAVRESGAGLLGMSALLTTTMLYMGRTIDALKEAGLRDRVKVLVGGAPVNPRYADEIGADGFAAEAGSVVEKAREVLGLEASR